MGSAPVFGCFLGYGQTGGAVIAVSAVKAAASAELSGLVDTVAASGAHLWPVASVLFELGPRPLPTAVTLDERRLAAFAGAEPGIADSVRSIAAGGATQGRLRRSLLRLSDLPFYRLVLPVVRRLLPVLIERRRRA